VAGAATLEAMGFGELAPAVASHPLSALLDDARFPRGWPSVVVSIADKHVAQDFLSIDQRLDDMALRYPAFSAEINAARRPAHRLEGELAEGIGLRPADLIDALRTAWQSDVNERSRS
jgi:hypothetical protein